MRARSVFNFYRPGYVPPNSRLAEHNLVAPEFQIVTASSIAGYLNFMQSQIAGTADLSADYSSWLGLAANATALLDELNTVLAAGQLSAATREHARAAIDSMAAGDDAQRQLRLQAAILLVMASPEYLVQK